MYGRLGMLRMRKIPGWLMTVDRRLATGDRLTTHLPDRFVQHDTNRVRQVEASDRTGHRNGKTALRVFLEDPLGHSLGLAAEHQAAVWPVRRLPVASFGLCREVKTAIPIHRVSKREPVGMDPEVHRVPVVQPGAAHFGIVDPEAQRLD